MLTFCVWLLGNLKSHGWLTSVAGAQTLLGSPAIGPKARLHFYTQLTLPCSQEQRWKLRKQDPPGILRMSSLLNNSGNSHPSRCLSY